MPHIILEHSHGMTPAGGVEKCLKDLNETLASFDTFKLEEIKSRIVAHETYRVGGSDAGAFVHLRLEILGGRPLELRKTVGKKLLELVTAAFQNTSHSEAIDFSLEIREMDRETYFKVRIMD